MTVIESPSTQLPWFVLKVKLRSEPVAVAALQSRGYCPLSPTYAERKRYSDRIKLVDKPLFPGYVFCQFDPIQRASVLSSLAVQYILGTREGPASLLPTEIEAINNMAKAGANPMPYLREGQRARIKFGPLSGLEGLVVRVKTSIRLVLSVELLQRSIFVEVDSDQLTAI